MCRKKIPKNFKVTADLKYQLQIRKELPKQFNERRQLLAQEGNLYSDPSRIEIEFQLASTLDLCLNNEMYIRLKDPKLRNQSWKLIDKVVFEPLTAQSVEVLPAKNKDFHHSMVQNSRFSS